MTDTTTSEKSNIFDQIYNLSPCVSEVEFNIINHESPTFNSHKGYFHRKLPENEKNSVSISFVIDKKYDHLEQSYNFFKFPEIKPNRSDITELDKDEILEFKWCDNLLSNYIKYFCFKTKNKIISVIDHFSLEKQQFLDQKNLEINEFDNQWSDNIKSFKIKAFLDWFYNEDEQMSWPLLFFKNNDDIEFYHKLMFEELSKLIMVRIRNDVTGSIRYINNDKENLRKYISSFSNLQVDVEMYAFYSNETKEAREQIIENYGSFNEEKQHDRFYIIKDSRSYFNETKDNKLSVDFKPESMYSEIYFACLDKTEAEYNVKSKYLSDSDTQLIKQSTFKEENGIVVFNKLLSEHTSEIFPLRKFGKHNANPGMNYFSFSGKTQRKNIIHEFSENKLSLICEFHVLNTEKEYDIILGLTYYRKVTIVPGKKIKNKQEIFDVSVEPEIDEELLNNLLTK